MSPRTCPCPWAASTLASSARLAAATSSPTLAAHASTSCRHLHSSGSPPATRLKIFTSIKTRSHTNLALEAAILFRSLSRLRNRPASSSTSPELLPSILHRVRI